MNNFFKHIHCHGDEIVIVLSGTIDYTYCRGIFELRDFEIEKATIDGVDIGFYQDLHSVEIYHDNKTIVIDESEILDSACDDIVDYLEGCAEATMEMRRETGYSY